MKIVVLVKDVPDTYGERTLSLETGIADRSADTVPDEIGERACEAALTYADGAPGTEVVVLSMGPERVVATLRKGLAMGAGAAIHIVDDALVGADLGLTAEVLAAAAERIGFDLLLAGNLSTDGSGGALPAMIAERLQVPLLSSLASVDISDDAVRGERVTERGTQRVSAALPAVISVTESLPDARFPNFKDIMAAKKKPLESLTLADLGVDADDPDASRSIMLRIAERPPRAAGVKIIDEGDAGTRLAEYLVQNRLV